MKLSNILSVLEEMAPLGYAEDFDNVGLLVGDPNQEISGVLVCHDALESVIDEAISKKCNLVVCFHPILFSGIKKITGKNYVERAIFFCFPGIFDDYLFSKTFLPKQNKIYKYSLFCVSCLERILLYFLDNHIFYNIECCPPFFSLTPTRKPVLLILVLGPHWLTIK